MRSKLLLRFVDAFLAGLPALAPDQLGGMVENAPRPYSKFFRRPRWIQVPFAGIPAYQRRVSGSISEVS